MKGPSSGIETARHEMPTFGMDIVYEMDADVCESRILPTVSLKRLLASRNTLVIVPTYRHKEVFTVDLIKAKMIQNCSI